MKNLSVSISKFLLSSVSAVTILLSFFLIFLIFDLWIQEGIPPFENIKFSVAVFLQLSCCLLYASASNISLTWQ